MNRIVLAFRAFFNLLFSGELSSDVLNALKLTRRGGAATPAKAAAAPAAAPTVRISDGALQMLGIMQRDARLVDFLMEDIAGYSDDQIGAAARDVHGNTREILIRHFAPAPVIDAVEGSPATAPDGNGALVKYVGNVPASGKPKGGVLRHKGWKATTANLPKVNSRQDLVVLAPAEIEVE